MLREDGSPAGAFRQACTLVDLVGSPFTSTFECAGSITLKDGTITMEGPFNPSQPENVAAITGGTGAYSTARGEIVVRAEADQIVVKLDALGARIRAGASRAPARMPIQIQWIPEQREGKPPGAQRRAAVRRRLLVTLLGLLLPHQAEVDADGLAVVAAGAAFLALVLLVAGSRLPDGAYAVVLALGTVLISAAAVLQRRAARRPGGLRRALLPLGRVLRRLLPAPPRRGGAGAGHRRRPTG